MHRVGPIALLTIAAAASPAAADATELGAYFGPRLFSSDSRLGYIEDAPGHPSIENGIQLGLRVARPFFPWLVPELEMAFSPTDTTAVAGAMPVSVLWLEPRIHMRFELLPGRRFQPFLVVGGGAPILVSSARKTLDSGVLGEAYAGAGLRFDTGRSFAFRFDARVSGLPGIERYVAVELDFSVGVELQLGKRKPRKAIELEPIKPLDRDDDGVVDASDKCVDRAEDADGFDDLDGCPDIDNDLDRVLDIADRCAAVAETYNGFDDDDGCPDTVPLEVDQLRGTVEGLLYAEGETVVRDSAQPNIQKIAKTMAAYPTIKVVLIGHTDDREANQFAIPVEGGAPPDFEQLAIDLSRARAEAVKQALVSAGVAGPRVEIVGKGFEEPVVDNDKPKGRLANRRVEIKLYVPPR
jgi:outer membrane protein OmpA-like peptidoglycan-associated protein